MKDRLHYQLLHATCHVIDALKDLDERLKWLERADLIAMSLMRQTARHDAVWESLNISAAQLKLLKELEEAKPSHGEHCNCLDCRTARGGEPI
jgi:hypothetical protein